MTETPLTEAEREIVVKILLASRIIPFDAEGAKDWVNSYPYDMAAMLNEARRQLGDPLQGWNAAIEAFTRKLEKEINDHVHETWSYDGSTRAWETNNQSLEDWVNDRDELIEAIRALQPPSSWPVSPLVEENARLRKSLQFYADPTIAPDGTPFHARDRLQLAARMLAHDGGKIARAALANHEPREGGEL